MAIMPLLVVDIIESRDCWDYQSIVDLNNAQSELQITYSREIK